MRLPYSLVMWMLQPLVRAKLRRRAFREPGYAHEVETRFGHYTREQQHWADANAAAPGPRIWVHAVSLGESRVAAVLVPRLREVLPGMRLLLTHGTATGWEQGRALLQSGDVQVWQPWDTPGAVEKFLDQFQPQLGLLIETEVWPNLVHGCAKASVPLCLVNARLSEQSLHKAQQLGWLSRPAFAALHAVYAQTEHDAARLRVLGAPVQGVTGNLKFDAAPDAQQLQRGRLWRERTGRPVVMFASSREGEEQLWLDALQSVSATTREALQAVQWLIVPRHPQRFNEVAELLTAAGHAVSRRSAWQDAPTAAPGLVWLGDSLGEMALYFGLSDIALLGGSFAPLGGQNLIEAAACACPVVTGPHTFNFADAVSQAVQAGAAFAVADIAAALEKVVALLGNADALPDARKAALAWSQAHRGAAQRTVDAVAPLLHRKA
jgi:3-deoxy-D-manno-octulosonic-acid transferase